MPRSFVCHGCLHLHLIPSSGPKLLHPINWTIIYWSSPRCWSCASRYEKHKDKWAELWISCWSTFLRGMGLGRLFNSMALNTSICWDYRFISSVPPSPLTFGLIFIGLFSMFLYMWSISKVVWLKQNCRHIRRKPPLPPVYHSLVKGTIIHAIT